MYYVEYMDKDGQVPCGSDSYLILDGRNTLIHMVEDAIENAKRKTNVCKWMSSYRIMRGSWLEGREVIALELDTYIF